MKVLSLIASSTEIVHALGCGKNLVGRSHECDFPIEVKSLPHCTEPSFDVEGSSKEIDDRVKSTLQSALSVYKVDEAILADLDPDVIITQSQCEVCAVSLEDVESAVELLSGRKPQIISLQPNSLSDIWNDINMVSRGLDVENRGIELVKTMKDKIQELNQSVKEFPVKTVACIEWIDPLMAAGNWVPTLVELAGGKNLFGEAGKHSPWMDFETLKSKDPDVIVVMPCGYNISKTIQEMKVLTDHLEWDSLSAVKEGRVYLTDGNQYFNRPGPRIIDSLEILIEILHEDKFDFSHHKSGWIKL